MGWNAWYNWAVILPAVSQSSTSIANVPSCKVQEITAAVVLMRDFFVDPKWWVYISIPGVT